ncbi:MAG: IS630 family transposase [Deltaproteobacteria bacterium]|jgi:transposase|nr:IS630 family transposase [Deltaproteobacteria bacterium]
MPFKRTRPELQLKPDVKEQLKRISKSRSEKASRVERAKMLLNYCEGVSVNSIARQLSTNRPKVDRCIDKALQIGAIAALDDLPRAGKPPKITPEAKSWLVSLACMKPKELGYASELWTNRSLAEHARIHCIKAGHPSLGKINRGTVSKILSKSSVRPHKISYYLDRRDPEFDSKMVQVLHVYKQVSMIKDNSADDLSSVYLSYDEKPGIQAISNIAPDLPPVPGKHPTVSRDYEYKRHGTVSFLAGIDLVTGHVHHMVTDRHRSLEFVTFLRLLDICYPDDVTIRIVLDNHSAHVSKETRLYLSSVPNRFDFIFTPKHGSWLNIIESFFAKMAKTFLRGIRVNSKDELKDRITNWVGEINAFPVVFNWKYGLDSLNEL